MHLWRFRVHVFMLRSPATANQLYPYRHVCTRIRGRVRILLSQPRHHTNATLCLAMSVRSRRALSFRAMSGRVSISMRKPAAENTRAGGGVTRSRTDAAAAARGDAGWRACGQRADARAKENGGGVFAGRRAGSVGIPLSR